MGGWAAERLVFGEASTGSNDDLARVTDLARRMVWECGMGERFGALAVTPAGLSGDGSAPAWSEATVAAIDHETRDVMAEACKRASRVVGANADVVDLLSAELVAVESIEGVALDRLLVQVGLPPTSLRAPCGPKQLPKRRPVWIWWADMTKPKGIVPAGVLPRLRCAGSVFAPVGRLRRVAARRPQCEAPATWIDRRVLQRLSSMPTGALLAFLGGWG